MMYWVRVPVIVRAVLVGFLVLVAGNFLPQGLYVANLRTAPSVPWSAALIAVWLWLYWQYISGRWWPASTSDVRRRHLRALPLTPQLWRWSMLAGGLAVATIIALTYALSRLRPLGLGFPEQLRQLPPVTMVTLVVTISLMAGIVEEAAFRGYMQSPIERRHGPVIAIAIVSAFFALAHLTGEPVSTPRMALIVIASIVYGFLARLSGSILPGVVLHGVGDIVGFALVWFAARAPASQRSTAGFGDPMFRLNVLVTVVLGVAAVWAFRGLGKAATAEREVHAPPVR